MTLPIQNISPSEQVNSTLYSRSRYVINHKLIEDITDYVEKYIKDSDWKLWASCKNTPTDIFLAPEYETPTPARDVARSICSTCPVKNTCAEIAVTSPEKYAFSVMAGVAIPYHPKKYRRTLKTLRNLSQDTVDTNNSVRWHIILTLTALELSDNNASRAWEFVSLWANRTVFTHVCRYLGVAYPGIEVVNRAESDKNVVLSNSDANELQSREI